MDKYDDETQDLHINFKKGETVLLNGKMAEEYFRLGSINFFIYGNVNRTTSKCGIALGIYITCLGLFFKLKIPY